jgi:hypothetical protein
MFKRKKFIVLSLVLLLILSSCNSGGKSNTNNEPTNNVVVPVTPPSSPNLMINVSPNNGGVCSNINTPCVSVTICSPTNPESCQTIDNVLIDSGSIGLRIFSSELNSSLLNNLPIESINGAPIANCVGYGDLSANWGTVALANINLGNESTIESIPMQLIDASYADGGEQCLQYLNGPSGSGSYTLETTPVKFGFNGILGVGPIIYDNVTSYFTCTDSSCSKYPSISQTNSLLLANPIAFLPESYESGITFKFPTLGNNGATNAVGYAVFGVGTNSDNNFESGVNIYTVAIDRSCGLFICMPTTLYGTSIQYGFLDTGSNFLYFNDGNISNNNGFYTPNSMLTLSPENTDKNDKNIATNINIANFDNLYDNTNNTSFNNNGADIGLDNFIDYGLPFFFGKTVYICFAGMTCNGVDGPYWAF